MSLPVGFFEHTYHSDQEIVDDILSEGIYLHRALGFIERKYKDPIVRPFFRYSLGVMTLDDLFNECLFDFGEVVRAGKFQVRGEGSIRKYLFTLVRNKTTRWVSTGSSKGNVYQDNETRELPSQEGSEREYEIIEFNFLEYLRTNSREKIRQLLGEMGNPCKELLAQKFGIPVDMIGKKESSLRGMWRTKSGKKKLDEIAEVEQKVAKDTDLAKLWGENSNTVSRRKQRCLGNLFIHLVSHSDGRMKDILLRQAGDYAIMIDDYWELTPTIIKYINDKKRVNKVLSAREVKAYEKRKEEDPRLAVYEQLVMSWIPTRIEDEDGFLVEVKSSPEDRIMVTFSISERRQLVKDFKDVRDSLRRQDE